MTKSKDQYGTEELKEDPEGCFSHIHFMNKYLLHINPQGGTATTTHTVPY